MSPEDLKKDNEKEDALIAELEQELWNSPIGSPECYCECDIPNCPYTH